MPAEGRTEADLPPVQERISTRARNIRIEVWPDGEVCLVIPQRVSRRAAWAFLNSRAAWVHRKLAETRKRKTGVPPRRPLRWDGRDQLPLRGRARVLHRVDAELAQIAIRVTNADIHVFAPANTTTRALSHALQAYLRTLARQDAQRCLDEEAARLGVTFKGPRIADQKSLWGSCAQSGLISLSWRLVLAPPDVLRYVVVHELCHRRHHDHSPRFWQLVARQLPAYETSRAWLHAHGAALHELLRNH